MHAIMLTDADWAIYGPKRLHSLSRGWIEQAELCSFEKEAIGGKKKKQAIDLSLSQIRIVFCVSEAVEKKHTVCFSGSREDPYTHWASVCVPQGGRSSHEDQQGTRESSLARVRLLIQVSEFLVICRAKPDTWNIGSWVPHSTHSFTSILRRTAQRTPPATHTHTI